MSLVGGVQVKVTVEEFMELVSWVGGDNGATKFDNADIKFK